jgi:hypothetical protein
MFSFGLSSWLRTGKIPMKTYDGEQALRHIEEYSLNICQAVRQSFGAKVFSVI